MRALLKSCALVTGLALVAVTSARAYNDTNPDDTINVGSASLFTVLAVGDMTQYNNNVTGPSGVFGNVGIGGHGNFTMSDGVLDGDLYMNNFGTVTLSGPAHITGHRHGLHEDGVDQTTTLNNALSDALALSNAAAAEASTSNYMVTVGTFNGTTVNTGKSITIAATGSGKVVLNLQDFVLTNGTFTLQGTAMNSFIINVSRNFSINNSSVILSGGLMASNVLFNVKGTGSQVSLNQGVSLTGILLAYQRKVDLSGGKVFGKVIANQVVITSGGQAVSQ
jgi:Putative Ice-binding-like adhesive domain